MWWSCTGIVDSKRTNDWVRSILGFETQLSGCKSLKRITPFKWSCWPKASPSKTKRWCYNVHNTLTVPHLKEISACGDEEKTGPCSEKEMNKRVCVCCCYCCWDLSVCCLCRSACTNNRYFFIYLMKIEYQIKFTHLYTMLLSRSNTHTHTHTHTQRERKRETVEREREKGEHFSLLSSKAEMPRS